MISDRYITTYMAGQARITEALAGAHDDDLAAAGDDYRDRRDFEVTC